MRFVGEEMEKIKICFRVDGHPELGMGHLGRCLALAQALQEAADTGILFLTKDYGEAIQKISKSGHLIESIYLNLSENEELEVVIKQLQKFKADILITDIPYRSEDYLKKLKEFGKLLVSIDDLALTSFCSDIVVSGYLSARLKKYISTNPNTKFFLDPSYLMLHMQFEKLNKTPRKIRERGRFVLVTLGGADPENLTAKAVRALSRINKKLEVTVVLGPAYVHHKELRELLKSVKNSKSKFIVEFNVKNMAKLMMRADVALSAGGETIYELAATGTPTISLAHIEHQSLNAQELERKGVVINLGLGRSVSEEKISNVVESLLRDKNLRQKMSIKGKKLVDGRGAKRAADLILRTCEKLGQV